MRCLSILPLSLAMLLGGGAAPVPRPQRIVSLNLCADQYLVALADRGQIAALTQVARDPAMSAVASAARSMPVIRGSAEEVLALRPDLIVAAPGRLYGPLGLIGRNGRVATLDVDVVDSYDGIRRQVREVAAAVGHPERGAALIADMDRRLARLPTKAGSGATAAYYQRRGYMTGGGTLVDELIRRVGLRNLATRLGKPALARVGLEEMALARPDYLIVESDSEAVVDRGTEMLRHPLLARIPRLRIPQAWTVCGGPAYVRAAASLSAQLRAR